MISFVLVSEATLKLLPIRLISLQLFLINSLLIIVVRFLALLAMSQCQIDPVVAAMTLINEDPVIIIILSS